MSLLTRLSLANRLIVGLVSVIVLVFGFVATGSLRQEMIPSMQLPSATVVGTFPGASPSSVETQLTKPLETALRGVTGVESVTSTTTSGSVQLAAAWQYGLDAAKVLAELRTASAAVQASAPTGATVEVFSGSFDDIPVLQLAVSSSADEPQAFAERVQTTVLPKLRGLEGVRQVDLYGEDKHQVTITVRPADAKNRKVEPSSIASVLQANGVVTAAGTATSNGTEMSIEVGTPISSIDELKNIPLSTESGPVLLSDVADVESGPVPETSRSRVDGEAALTLSVVKTVSGNVVSVSHAVQAALPALEKELGEGVTFTTLFDQAPYIEQSIHDLSVEGGLGLVFAILVILVFLLSVRATLITAISIPLSLLIAMIGLSIGGYSLSIFTLGALTIAVGRVVDDSIVVIENIKRRQGDEELTPAAIVAAVRQVSGAITASTLTTVAVFLPIAFVSGITGELFRPFAVTVTVALLASLVVALTVVPVLAYWFLRRPPKPRSAASAERARLRAEAYEARESERLARIEEKAQARLEKKNARRAKRGKDLLVAPAPAHRVAGAASIADDGPGDAGHDAAPDRLQRAYLPVLRTVLRRPIATLLVAVLVFGGTIALASQLKMDFLGDQGEKTVTFSQELPLGASLDQTDAAAKKLEDVISGDSDVKQYLTTVGGAGSSNIATLSLTLTDDADVAITSARLQEEFDSLEGVGSVSAGGAGGSLGGGLVVTVTGENESALGTAAASVQTMMASLDGVTSVTSDLAAEQPILKVNVDRAAAARYGFTQSEIGIAVSSALRGTPIGTLDVDNTTQDILLRSQRSDASPQQIADMPLPVSAIQQQSAVKSVTDALTAESDEAQRQAEAEADDAAAEQLAEARSSRSEAQTQLAQLQGQLAALEAAASVPAVVPPVTAEQIAQQLQAQQTMEQIAQLQQAVASTQGAVEGADEQITAMQDAQAEQAEQRAESEAFAQRQKDAQDVTATPIAVKDIATVEEQKAPSTISRVDGERTVTISGVQTGDDLGAISAALASGLDSLDLPAGVTATVGGVSADQDESFAQLGLAMLAAVALVFLVMVGTFKSFVQPLILLISVPFAATGAIALLLITDTALGLPAMIGLLMLIGIVVTNAIVLIDLINHVRERGTSVTDAIVEGARLRLRPIIMTACATIFALVPMSLGLTGGGVFISKPLAIVVIGGLVSSTVLTLVLVPVLYSLIERRKERRDDRAARRRASRAEAEKETEYVPFDQLATPSLD